MTRRLILIGIGAFIAGICFEAGRIHASAGTSVLSAMSAAVASHLDVRR